MHAATFICTRGDEAHKELRRRVNVEGKRDLVRVLARSAAKLVHISTDYVDIMGTGVTLALHHADLVTGGTLHIGAERRRVYELARNRSLNAELGVRREAGVDLCKDVKRCQAFKESFDLNCRPAAVNLEGPSRRY